jgi:hypothetical protein
MHRLILLLSFISLCSCRPDYILSDKIPPVDKEREARVLSAFFGLDNDLPRTAVGISRQAPGKDGMPVVFSHELSPASLQPSDFKVKTQSGEILDVDIVSFKPAIEAYELRTVLLIGELGSFPENEPVEVQIVGDLLTRSGQNYIGQKVEVTSLEQGPFLSYAEYFIIDDAYPYLADGRGCDCPKEGTQTVVRTVWAGGVRALNGMELGDAERMNFTVTLKRGKDTILTEPYRIADLGDNDNNIDLCIKEIGLPIKVSVLAQTAIDPRDDVNEYTELEVLSRW